MNVSDYTYSSIPSDLGLKIASSLEVPDISSLSCCSRVWRDICDSDCLWEALFKAKWPLLYEGVAKDPNFKGWRAIYMKQHKETKDKDQPFTIRNGPICNDADIEAYMGAYSLILGACRKHKF